MENIVQLVSLSKGGVYRIYPSTTAILRDLILKGMHLRNAFYEQQVRQEIGRGQPLTLPFLVGMIADSLLLYPEISSVYVEFLWEKQRNPALEELYREICADSVQETLALIRQYGADSLLLTDEKSLERLTELMNAAILSIHVLQLQDLVSESRAQLTDAILRLIQEP